MALVEGIRGSRTGRVLGKESGGGPSIWGGVGKGEGTSLSDFWARKAMGIPPTIQPEVGVSQISAVGGPGDLGASDKVQLPQVRLGELKFFGDRYKPSLGKRVLGKISKSGAWKIFLICKLFRTTVLFDWDLNNK